MISTISTVIPAGVPGSGSFAARPAALRLRRRPAAVGTAACGTAVTAPAGVGVWADFGAPAVPGTGVFGVELLAQPAVGAPRLTDAFQHNTTSLGIHSPGRPLS
ncbi:MAG TPA: hypothetical protein VHF92_08475 [Geodermatophilus sp.]|nr:hypothetical protein [Geodermatophilus sp.]